jgi:flagellar M-ring protein FliF
MAQAPAQSLNALARGFGELSITQKVGLLVGISAIVALVVVALLWARVPEYRVLYSNLSDRDGGDVIAALGTLNIPYRVAEGGTAILVPAGQVYDTRLKLASQGLPRGGAVGFELMETQKFGISQFAEQVNYQRALAGELSRTIQSLAPVQSARVHLAIPRPSVFVREQQKPTASVLVSLYPARSLDEAQVSAIQHLVASAVPELPARGVTVVDQAGNLLTGSGQGVQPGGLDASQIKYLHALESAYAARIENILQPIVGRDNVRAQVAASLDFSHVEQTSETFRPNPAAAEQAIRSQQTVETTSTNPSGPSGVPGALSNQPPGAASAPLTAPGAAPQSAGTAQPASTSAHRENTVNFELDKTIRHTRNELGAVKRLSVAVVVNHRRNVAASGRITFTPRSEAEMTQFADLAREAMGFERERGDTVNVVNAPFSLPDTGAEGEGVEAPSVWKDWLQKQITPEGLGRWGAYAFIAAVLVYAWFGLLAPTVRDLIQVGRRVEPAFRGGAAEAAMAAAGRAPSAAGYDSDLRAVKDLARQDPRVVANVVKGWVGRNE